MQVRPVANLSYVAQWDLLLTYNTAAIPVLGSNWTEVKSQTESCTKVECDDTSSITFECDCQDVNDVLFFNLVLIDRK